MVNQKEKIKELIEAAAEILKEYSEPHIDIGNVYFAATTYQEAYSLMQDEVVRLASDYNLENERAEECINQLMGLQDKNQKLRQLVADLSGALGKYANKSYYSLYEDIDWTDNWLGECEPGRLLKVGTSAKKAIERKELVMKELDE